MSLQGLEHGSICWIDLAYDRDRRWALSHAALDMGFNKLQEIN
jgi:hypothetical protein